MKRLLMIAMFAIVAVLLSSCEKEKISSNILEVELITSEAVAEVQIILVCQGQSIFHFDSTRVGSNTLILTDTALEAAAKPGAYLSIIMFRKEKGELIFIKDHFYDLNPLTGNDKVVVNL